MIGDWVYIHHNGKAPHHGKVTALLSSGAVETEIDGSLALSSSVDPIPLTPEILEKNGFKMFALNEDEAVGFCGKWWSNDGNVMVKKFKFKYEGDMFYMSSRNSKISNIRSVHQFQHALRLVGVDKEITI